MNDSQKRLSDLIGQVYEAALDQSLWPGVIKKTAQFVGGIGAALYSKDAVAQQASLNYEAGIGPYYTRLYFEKYVTLDPSTTGQFFADIGQPIAIADLIPYDEFLETRFYKEWVRPHRLRERRSRQIDNQRSHVRCLPPRAGRHRR